MVVDYKDMVELLEKNKDLFSVEQMANLLMDAKKGLLIRCSFCGRFMTNGYDLGDDIHYCSKLCMDEKEDRQDIILHAYGLDSSPIAKLKGRIDDDLLEEICMFTGEEPDSYEMGYLISDDLANRLNKALARWE